MNKLLPLILLAAGVMAAGTQGAKPRIIHLGYPDTTRKNIYAGIEFAELKQNNFRDLGPRNFTVIAGQRFWQSQVWSMFGWRFLAINVDLSNEHLRDTTSVIGIEGNRDNLVGHMSAVRAYMDFYPPQLDFIEISGWQRYILSVTPIVSLAPLGYTAHSYTDTAYADTYLLRAFTPGVSLRLNTTILDCIFVETPVIDLHLLLFKNRPVDGEVGEAYIDRPENVGMFGWVNLGVKVRF